MFDYATLKIIWWLLVGVLLIGFAIMDGHDMGVGTLLPFAGRNGLRHSIQWFLLGHARRLVGTFLQAGRV